MTTLPSRCLAKQHQLLIDRLAGELRQLAVVDHQVDFRIAAQPVENIEPAAAAVALQLVARVGDGLQLGDHELRHDELVVDHARFDDVGDAAVDHDARIEHVRLEPLHFLGELDVRNDEAEVVLGLQQHADAACSRRSCRARVPSQSASHVMRRRQQRRERELEDVGEKQADDRAEVNGRDRVEPLAAHRDSRQRARRPRRPSRPESRPTAANAFSPVNQRRRQTAESPAQWRPQENAA